MMIVLVIIISYSSLLVSSANYLPFLNPNKYSTVTNCYAARVSLPSPLQFGSSCYTDAYVSIYIYIVDTINLLLFRLVILGWLALEIASYIGQVSFQLILQSLLHTGIMHTYIMGSYVMLLLLLQQIHPCVIKSTVT